MKGYIVWYITPRSPFRIDVSEFYLLLYAGFQLGLFLGPEYGGDMFFLNVG
jgi:hypothetical protein